MSLYQAFKYEIKGGDDKSFVVEEREGIALEKSPREPEFGALRSILWV